MTQVAVLTTHPYGSPTHAGIDVITQDCRHDAVRETSVVPDVEHWTQAWSLYSECDSCIRFIYFGFHRPDFTMPTPLTGSSSHPHHGCNHSRQPFPNLEEATTLDNPRGCDIYE